MRIFLFVLLLFKADIIQDFLFLFVSQVFYFPEQSKFNTVQLFIQGWRGRDIRIPKQVVGRNVKVLCNFTYSFAAGDIAPLFPMLKEPRDIFKSINMFFMVICSLAANASTLSQNILNTPLLKIYEKISKNLLKTNKYSKVRILSLTNPHL